MAAAEDVDTLISWVREESPTRDAAAVNRMGERFVAALAGAPVRVERLAGRDGLGDPLILRAGPDNGQAPGVMLGHLDTVHPLGTAARDLRIHQLGHRLYGPGVYDMKGGLLIGLRAFVAAAVSGKARRPLAFILSPDEEIGSPTSRDVIEAEAKGAAFALVLEPAREDGSCVTARKAVGRFKVEVFGRASHAGVRHQDGRSAILEAAQQIVELEGLTDYDEGVTVSVGLVAGGTGVNVVPDHCRLDIDFRAPSADAACRCEARIRMLSPHRDGVYLGIDGGVNRPAYERSAANAQLFARAQSIGRDLGLMLAESPMTGGGSDGNFTAALGVPTLDGLGVDGAGAHTLEEFAILSTVPARRTLVERLLEQ